MDKLAKRMDWVLKRLMGIFEVGLSGSDPSNEASCCRIRSSRAFVTSLGFGWRDGMIWTMNAVVTAENKPAYRREMTPEDNALTRRKGAYKKHGGV